MNCEKEICFLPKNCEFLETLKHKFVNDESTIRLMCRDLEVSFDFDEFNKSNSKCRLSQDYISRLKSDDDQYRNRTTTRLQLIFKSTTKNLVLDNTSTHLTKLVDYVGHFNICEISFIGLKGFNLESSNEINANKISFYNTDFNFYNRDLKLIRSCEDATNETLVKSNLSFFLKSKFKLEMIFSSYNYGIPICDLLFENSDLSMLEFRHLVNSYYKKNLLAFTSTNESKNVNSYIETVTFNDFFGLDLNSDLLNECIFVNTLHFSFKGHLNSIQTDLFMKMKSLKSIEMNPIYFLDICHKQGIDWIKNINSYINISLERLDSLNIFDSFDQSDDFIKMYVDYVLGNLVEIQMADEREYMFEKTFQFIYDEDFCLFKDFPFNQLVTFSFWHMGRQTIDNCVTRWLTQQSLRIIRFDAVKGGFYKLYFGDDFYERNFSASNCDQVIKIDLCNKSQFTAKKVLHSEASLNFMVVSEFLVILFSPLVSIAGIILNILVIVVIVKKENRKELKEKQYTYMAIHSVTNIVICFLQILSLVNECQSPFGIYCSSIRQLVFFQYFKIIFGEYFSSLLRLMSNFTYVAFAFNRVSLIGKDHNFLTKFMADVGIKNYIGVVFFISAGLSVVKALRFEINIVHPDDQYPLLFNQNEDNYLWRTEIKYQLILIFNAVYDLINYVLFIVINFLVDILLIVKLRQVMTEREEKLKDQSEQLKEKVKIENQESFRKVISMIIFSSCLSMLLKTPIVITSVNDLRLLTTTTFRNTNSDTEYRHWFTFPYTMKYFCSSDRICEIFQSFGNFLFLISLSSNFIFLRTYDKKFALSYRQTFNKPDQEVKK